MITGCAMGMGTDGKDMLEPKTLFEHSAAKLIILNTHTHREIGISL